MSPRRPVHMPLYAVVVLVVMSTLGPVLSITASVKVAQGNARELLQAQDAARNEQQAESRRLVCAYFAANLDGYDEVPPTTPAGKNIVKVNLDFYRAAGCAPPRK